MSDRPPATFPKVNAEQTFQNIIATFRRQELNVGEIACIEEEITGTTMNVRSVLCEEVNWCTHLCTYTDPQNHRLMIAIKLTYGVRRARREIIIHLDQDGPDEGCSAWIDSNTQNDVMDVMRTICMSQCHLTADRISRPFPFGTFMTFVERIATATAKRNTTAPGKRRAKARKQH